MVSTKDVPRNDKQSVLQSNSLPATSTESECRVSQYTVYVEGNSYRISIPDLGRHETASQSCRYSSECNKMGVSGSYLVRPVSSDGISGNGESFGRYDKDSLRLTCPSS